MGVSRQVLFYKLRAAAVSFLVFLVFAVVVAVMSYRFWYPDFLFWLDGGIQGLRLVYAVDFVLGPLLALVFFHPEKTRGKLVFDLIVVIVVQFSAMGWGAYQVYKERPVAVVYGSERFISVAPAIMGLQSKKPEDFSVYSTHKPPFVYRREPVGDKERQRQVIILFRHGIHNEAQAWLFQPFLENLDKVFADSNAVLRYVRQDADLGPEWNAWLVTQGADAGAFRLAFYEGRFANAVLIFDPQGNYKGYLSMGEVSLPTLLPEPASQQARIGL